MRGDALFLISSTFCVYFIAEETRIHGVDEIVIKTIAKVVPRSSLPNQGVGVDMILGQDVSSHKTSSLTF